jgi:PAS domain S-box-containing protein
MEIADRLAGQSLAQALIAASHLPLVLFDGDLRVVSVSRSFCTAFGLDGDDVAGRRLAELGAGEWNLPELHDLLASVLAGQLEAGSYEADLARPQREPRRLILDVQRVQYEDAENPRVLLAINDVTALRDADRLTAALLFEKDDLLRERATLMQEMQHRVANSLQIIASVLMLKARHVKSEESRLHLRDAHDRVLSLAAVQQHLQASLGDVEVEPYLTKLCETLAASMIRDQRPLTLRVRADAATVTSREAVSLGLIVTELVINALKHAFPSGGGGLVAVDYEVAGEGWTLSVTDDGVGRPVALPTDRVGLGTTVVGALAKQLLARVVMSDAAPGAKIAIVNTGTPQVGTAA